MNRMYQWILKKAAALLLVLAMSVSGVSAVMAAGSGWEDLQITISWEDENGNTHTADASAVTVSDSGEGCFWVMLPPDAPLDALAFSASHPDHEITYIPNEGNILEGVTDAGNVLDGFSFVPVTIYDPESGTQETFCLYVSTQTDQPVIQGQEEPEDDEPDEDEPDEDDEAARLAAEEQARREAEEEAERRAQEEADRLAAEEQAR